ncbi:SIT4 phosphatase-associated family protein [Zea mays]|uniref:SIT4 phosphatase-associated family protein n=1 Tax=Zea mays TaxID=4577 RepID=A0A1D6FY81_MAIZE|nr:SIT4 phosphatase-associated family protein [Zea mays]
MFWRMTGLSAASPVDTILDKENFTLEELLDEDEIIQECKALNSRLINFLRDKAQVEQLLRYVVEEVPDDAERKRSFKFPFIASEIFTCEIDVILRTLVEDEELMDLLFSFVKPDHPHSTLLSGYFSKVVICLVLRKTAPLMSYVQGHPEIVVQLVDLIGITSIMEVLIRLIGADETIYSNYGDTLQWLENTNVLEMIADKFNSSIVEFISVLLTIGSETAEKELVRQSAIKRSIDLFFEYPYNNFLHHHVENIIVSCLEGKRPEVVEHVLHECDIVGKILVSERLSSLSTESNGPTVPTEGKTHPRVGNVGHMTRIANKLIQLGNSNNTIQAHLQENNEWVEWQTNVLVKRNEVENVYHWACGRPASLHDRGRDSDDDDFRDRDYDVAALANNLSQAFRYGIYSSDDIEEAQGSLERDDEDVYFDDESAEVVISSLRLGDDQEGSLFTNSNWFTFDGERGIDDRSSASVPSSSPNSEETSLKTEEADDGKVIGTEDEMETVYLGNGSVEEVKDVAECTEQPNCCTEEERLKNEEGMEWHPNASNNDTEAEAAAESSAPSVEIVAEKTVDEPLEVGRKLDEPAESSLDSSVSVALPAPVNGSEPANSEVSSEQVAHATDVQQPVKEAPAEDDDAKKTDAAKTNE